MVLIIVVIISLIVLSIAGFVFYPQITKAPNTSTNLIANITRLVPSPSPAPFAFQEMTVPFLRSRVYESSLSDLDQAIDQTNYLGYLTSYNSDGLEIDALLTIPKGTPPPGGWPGLVFVHGYIPPKSYQTLVNYNSFVDYISQRGVVVLKIDLRGHGNSQGDPGGAYYSADYVVDTLNAYVALKKENTVNPNKIAVWGHSMAGNVVFRAMASKPDIPKVIIWAGAGYTYSDLSKYQINDGSYRPQPSGSPQQLKREQLFNTYGRFSPDSWFWKQVPATNYLSEIKGKIQIHHAVDDPVVSIGYSRDLNQLLNSSDIPHELYEYPSGGHNMTGQTFTSAMNRTVEFIKN